jgi:DNA-directed RNA polymerase subunit L
MTTLTWKWNSTTPYIVNALRRTILSDLDVVAVPDAPLTAVHSSGIKIVDNTGKLHNEILSHRLTLLPINLEPKDLAYGIPEMELHMAFSDDDTFAKQGIVVSGDHIRFTKQPVTKIYPMFDAPDFEASVQNGVIRKCAASGTSSVNRLDLASEIHADVLVHLEQLNSPMITRLYERDTLYAIMRPRVATAKENGAFSCIKQCNFIQHENDTDFQFTVATIDSNHDMRTLVQTAFDKLLLRLHRLHNYITGGIEIDVGAKHMWLQTVIDPSCKAIITVNETVIYGVTLSGVHGSRMCLELPSGTTLAAYETIRSIRVETLESRGELEFQDITITRRLLLQDNVLEKHPFVIRVDHESHTLGNAVQGHIFENRVSNEASPLIEFSYSKPYPLDDYILFRIHVANSPSINDYLAHLSQSVHTTLRHIESERERVMCSLE